MDTSEPLPLPAPRIEPSAPPGGKWEREHQAFCRLLPRLLMTHRGKYVVIHEGQVVDSGDDDLALALRFFAHNGNVPIHVGLVTEEAESPARIPHYREAGRTGDPA